jgi:hypothetical protein
MTAERIAEILTAAFFLFVCAVGVFAWYDGRKG